MLHLLQSALVLSVLLALSLTPSSAQPTDPSQCATPPQSPQLPKSFKTLLTTTADLLPDPKSPSDYPPKYRAMELTYSYELGFARIEIMTGYEAGKSYLRRYGGEGDADLLIRPNSDYQIRRARSSEDKKNPPAGRCLRSHLGEDMPPPQLPLMVLLGFELIDGLECAHWVRDDGDERVHVYYSPPSGSCSGDNAGGEADGGLWTPRRLIHESVDFGVATKLMTYDFTDFEALDNEETTQQRYFTLNSIEDGLVEAECERFIGGFPYIHLFHYYLRA
jgi:hypothetical protein